LRHAISFIETEAQIHPGNNLKVAYSLLNCGVSGIKAKHKKAFKHRERNSNNQYKGTRVI
jgi:hypothetical protein